MIGQLLLDRYRIDSLLGEGGTSSVYVATDQKTRHRVAVKVIALPEDMARADAETLVERELRALMLIEHPCCVKLLDWSRLDDANYALVTELLIGRDLETAIEESGPLPEPAWWALAEDVLSALAVAHDKHIAHRDIKPANVFLCETGRVVLIDFGIARATDQSAGKTLARSANTGLMGTPHYFAPELLAGVPFSTASDIYSFGSTMFHAINGTPPFDGRGLHEVLEAVSKNERAPLRPHVSAESRGFIDACMMYQPAERPPNAAAAKRLLRTPKGARDALRSYASPSSQTQIATAAAVRPARRARRWPWLIVAATLLAFPAWLAIRPRPRSVLAVPDPVAAPPPPAPAPVPEPLPVVAEAHEDKRAGAIRLVLRQWCDVSIDGVAKGRKQSAARFKLSEGSHVIVVSNPAFGEREMRVRIKGGEEQALTVDFTR